MALPIGFEIDKCIPTEEDIKVISDARSQNNTSIFTDSALVASSAQPFYYELIRKYIACKLIDWKEAENTCKYLLINAAPEETFDEHTLHFLVPIILAKKANDVKSANQYTIVGYGSVGTRKDSAYDLGSAKARAEKMLQDKFVQKVDILQQNNLIWSSKSMQAQSVAEAIEKHDELKEGTSFKDVTDWVVTGLGYDNVMARTSIKGQVNSKQDITNYINKLSSQKITLPKWKRIFISSDKHQFVWVFDVNKEGKWEYSKGDYNEFKKIKSESLIESLEEAVEKHETLNPKLFDGMELKQEVKDKIEDITNTMIKLLSEEEIKLEVRDVIMTGSNASYNYTKDSDIDVHILAKTSNLNDPDKIYPKLYNAYRRIFANKYDISFYGIPVEVYIEVEGNETVSNGSYSVMFDHWVKEPSATAIPEIDQKAIDEAAKPWKEEAEELLKKEDLNGIDEYIKHIYELRQKGLYSSEGVEFSTENLIFKEVRNAGLLDKLKEHRDELVGKELSLESLEEAIDEKTRRDYVVQITRLTHYQPVVHPNGQFEIHLVKEDDIQYVLTILRRQNWVQDCHSVPGKFDFSHVSSFSLPARYHTVMGKIRD